MARHNPHRDNGHDEWFYPVKPDMSGRFDQNGQLIVNETTTYNLHLPNEHEVTEQRRAAHAAYAHGSGDWTSFYACWDTTKLGRER
jgi:hypothetical protein